jgi:hypothetical protein
MDITHTKLPGLTEGNTDAKIQHRPDGTKHRGKKVRKCMHSVTFWCFHSVIASRLSICEYQLLILSYKLCKGGRGQGGRAAKKSAQRYSSNELQQNLFCWITLKTVKNCSGYTTRVLFFRAVFVRNIFAPTILSDTTAEKNVFTFRYYCTILAKISMSRQILVKLTPIQNFMKIHSVVLVFL